MKVKQSSIDPDNAAHRRLMKRLRKRKAAIDGKGGAGKPSTRGAGWKAAQKETKAV